MEAGIRGRSTEHEQVVVQSKVGNTNIKAKLTGKSGKYALWEQYTLVEWCKVFCLFLDVTLPHNLQELQSLQCTGALGSESFGGLLLTWLKTTEDYLILLLRRIKLTVDLWL